MREKVIVCVCERERNSERGKANKRVCVREKETAREKRRTKKCV